MLNKDKKRNIIWGSLDKKVMMIFLADIVALLIVLLGAFFNSGFDVFSINTVIKIASILVLIAAVEVFGWTAMSAYLKYKRSNK
ncbi:hypothetical protein GCWU000322_00424 [Eubacterium saphenum ATCC 49989]|nr:hypothetical protein GCWU000322_00424 [Eubacterium saphenum ATCC 49989]